MAYTIRKTLRDKMEAAFAAAVKKEGRDITAEPLGDTRLERKDIAYCGGYDGNKSYLLLDGRYVTQIWDAESNTYPLMVIDNLPVEVLRCLVLDDHNVATQERQKDDHEDYEYQNYLKRTDAGESNLVNPMDRCACWDGYFADRSNENDGDDGFDYRFEPIRKPDNAHRPPVIGYTPNGCFDAETQKEIHKSLRGFLRKLPKEKQEWFYLLYSSKVPQKKLAVVEEVSEAAMSKRKKWYEDKTADYLQSLGYPVLSKSERTKEKKKRQKAQETYEKHYAEVSKALREIYCPDEDEGIAIA